MGAKHTIDFGELQRSRITPHPHGRKRGPRLNLRRIATTLLLIAAVSACKGRGSKDNQYKTEKAIREAGKLRVEGKTYVMQDSDVCHFLFNV